MTHRFLAIILMETIGRKQKLFGDICAFQVRLSFIIQFVDRLSRYYIEKLHRHCVRILDVSATQMQIENKNRIEVMIPNGAIEAGDTNLLAICSSTSSFGFQMGEFRTLTVAPHLFFSRRFARSAYNLWLPKILLLRPFIAASTSLESRQRDECQQLQSTLPYTL